MRSQLFLLFLFRALLYCHCTSELIDESTTLFENSTTISTTIAENITKIEPARCQTNEDCQEYHIDTGLGNMIICDETIKICIIAIVEEKPTVAPNQNVTTSRPKKTTKKPKYTTLAEEEVSATTEIIIKTTQPPIVDIAESEFHSIPVVVWVLFTIPFISIIVLGIICGRRLKMQSENIQENLLRTTINGVHVDQLLSQRDIINSAAFSCPPPTYEKATGEIPPSYETVLQGLQEKRQSIFQCDSLMNEPDKDQYGDTRSFGSSVSSARSYISNHAGRGRRPIIYSLSRNNMS